MSQDEIIKLIDSHNSENNYATIAQAIKASATVIAAPEKNYRCTRYTCKMVLPYTFGRIPKPLRSDRLALVTKAGISLKAQRIQPLPTGKFH